MANSTYIRRRVDANTGQVSDTAVERTDAEQAEYNELQSDFAFLDTTDEQLQALTNVQFRRAVFRIAKRILTKYLHVR